MTLDATSMRAAGSPCIVGWSVISPIGVGRQSFVDGWRAGPAGRGAPAGDGGPGPDGFAAAGFDFGALLGTKGTRTLDRMTLMVIAATAMALADQPEHAGADHSGVGLVLGTSTGSLASITDFLRDTFAQDKPYFVNPAAFPNTVMNNAAGRTAIWHGLRGLNSTVAGGHVSGLSALRYATRMIRRGYADTLLVGAVEELSETVGWAAELRGRPAPSGPAGPPLGEGCVVFLVDDAETAARRGRPALAELVDFEFDVAGADEPWVEQSDRLATAIATLLGRNGVEPADLWLVSMAQSGNGGLDAAEQRAVERALGAAGRSRRIAAARQLGDSFSALGAFQLAAILARAEAQGGPALDRPSLITSLGVDGAVACALVRA
jgi:3-oxoacyl-[acyl-carrier-protein] synthase II